MQCFVERYNSDKAATDVARVLRVPGFYHHKDAPFKVSLVRASKRKPYTKKELWDAFDLDSRIPNKKEKTRHTPGREVESDITLGDAICGDITIENCEKYLPDPKSIDGYAAWRDIGMIMHHQFHGSDEALAIFNNWSSEVENYNGYDDVENNWLQFGNRTEGKLLTFRSLISAYNKKQAVETTEDLRKEVYEKAERLLADCKDVIHLTGTVAPRLWSLADGIVVLEKDFTQAVRKRFSELQPGSELSPTEAKRAMKTKRKEADDYETAAMDFKAHNGPKWCRNWVWVSEEELFLNTETCVALTSRGFSAHFDSHLPKGDNAPSNAANHVRNNYYVPKVMRTRYMPGFDPIFEHEGISCVNTYTENFRCAVPEEVTTPGGLKAVALFRRHIELMFGGWNREAQIFCNFLMCAVASPPIKVRWAPVIIGAQGDGKSLLYDLIAAGLGVNNTRQIKGSTIANAAQTSFSGWMQGHCFGAIEEVKWHGRNRYEIINFLKDYITNKVVECHAKNQDTKNLYNFVNFLIFTNYLDAIPIEMGDRRYYVVQSKVPLVDLLTREPAYFSHLTDAIHKNPGDIICWIRSIEWHKDFIPDAPAPITAAKRAAIIASTDDVQEVVEELIQFSDDPLISDEAICFLPLFSKVQTLLPGIVKSDQDFKVAGALTKLGFAKVARTSIEGERQAVWGRRHDREPATIEWARAVIYKKINEKSEGLELI
jgi:hypothetical protein